jgi:hypothetical protein
MEGGVYSRVLVIFSLSYPWCSIFNPDIFVKQHPTFSYTLRAISYIKLSLCNARIHRPARVVILSSKIRPCFHPFFSYGATLYDVNYSFPCLGVVTVQLSHFCKFFSTKYFITHACFVWCWYIEWKVLQLVSCNCASALLFLSAIAESQEIYEI